MIFFNVFMIFEMIFWWVPRVFGKVPASKCCKMQQTHMLKPEIIKKNINEIYQ